MNNTISKISGLLLIFLTLFVACNDDKAAEIGTPFSKLEGIADTWKLQEIKQTDLITAAAEKQVDLSGIFVGSTPAIIEFRSDFTYSLTNNDSKVLVPESGTWSFDNNEFPTQVILQTNQGEIILNLLAPVRERVDQYLHFQYIRPSDCLELEGIAGAIAYEYKFIRNN